METQEVKDKLKKKKKKDIILFSIIGKNENLSETRMISRQYQLYYQKTMRK